MKTPKILVRISYTLAAILICYLSFLVLVMGPVDIRQDNCLEVSGTVEKISKQGTNDLVFKLKGVPFSFYINRGLERGLDMTLLRSELLSREIKLWHARSWPFKGGHITQLQYDGQIIYSEYK